jgi:peptidoglycan/LPS O-acetylase OafA/YrhL
MRFYVIFGISYFLLGEKNSARVLVGLFAVGLFLRLHHSVETLDAMPQYRDLVAPMDRNIGSLIQMGLWGAFADTLSYGMFASGVYFARYFQHGDKWALLWAAILGILSGVIVGPNGDPYGYGYPNWLAIAAGLVLMALIPLSCAVATVRRVWSSPLLVFLGFVSYPLYLLHQNALVALIVQLHTRLPGLPALLLPALPMALLVGAAWLIARYAEPFVRERIRRGCAYLYASAATLKAAILSKLGLAKS